MLSLVKTCLEDDDKRSSSIQKRASDHICNWIIFHGNAALMTVNKIENDQGTKLKMQAKISMQMNMKIQMKIVRKCK
jgi:hypothetical protein